MRIMIVSTHFRSKRVPCEFRLRFAKAGQSPCFLKDNPGCPGWGVGFLYVIDRKRSIGPEPVLGS
jgi:hypothetical protein